MDDLNKTSFTKRPGFKPHDKFNNKNRGDHKGFNKGKDKQRGLVQAFVKGKGQNAALQWLMDTKTPVSLFLMAGLKFDGIISSFDAFTISIVDSKQNQQVVYKDKISTITIKKPESHRIDRHDGLQSRDFKHQDKEYRPRREFTKPTEHKEF